MLAPMPGAPPGVEKGLAAAPGGRGSGGPAVLSSLPQEERIRGRPGSQGGGETFATKVDPGRVSEEDGKELPDGAAADTDDATVAAEKLLRMYGESFDLVACGGHSFHLITDFVVHFVGGSGSDEGGVGTAAAAGARSGWETGAGSGGDEVAASPQR